MVGGRPLLVRSRDLRHTAPDPARPNLLVVSLSYPVRDDVQLPSEDDYDHLSAFEHRAFDGVGAIVDLVFVETGSGMVRYYCYTSDVDRAVDVIAKASGSDDALDFSSAEDPQWLVYQRRAAALGGS
jgi:hypothetical protein